MGAIRRVTMAGGPKDGRTYPFPEPLPRVFCFQQFTIETGWLVHEYGRADRLVYSFLRSRRAAAAAEEFMAATP